MGTATNGWLPSRDVSGEVLIKVISSEIDKRRSHWASCDGNYSAVHIDLLADIMDGFGVFYHRRLVPTRYNRV